MVKSITQVVLYFQLAEFIMACVNKKTLLQDENLNRAFKTIDRDGSGSISLKELRHHFSHKIEEEVWRELMS